MDEHKLTTKREGSGHTATMQGACSCGWTGNKIPAWNDYQHTRVREEKREHTSSTTGKAKDDNG